MLTLTEEAAKQILSDMEQDERPNLALRIGIVGRGPRGFRYEMELASQEEKRPDDVEVDVNGLKVFVDGSSAPKLKGATVELVQQGVQRGFRIDNPNSLWDDPTAAAVQRVIDEQLNPALGHHGGVVTLVEVKGDVAYISLGGGCQGCGMANVTVKQGIEAAIKQAVPEIRQVLDTTDHAAGSNPLFQGGESGRPPF